MNGGECVGRQIRTSSGKPKYYTKHNGEKDRLWSLIDRGSNMLVVVEDLLSGIRVARYMDALVLFGNYIHPKAVSEVASRKYDKILIWLDNDNAQVISNAERIKRRLDMHTRSCVILRHGTDPKNCDEPTIREVLDGH